MRRQVYQSSLMNSMWWRNLWMVVALIMVCSNLALIYWLYNKDLAEKTVFLPPDVSTSFWIKGEDYSASYLSELAHYIAQLTLSYSPANIEYQHRKVLEQVTPLAYDTVSQRLTVDAKAVREKNVSAVFYPVESKVLDNRVAIIGLWRYNIKGQLVEERQIVWRVDFEKRAGRLLVSHFYEVDQEEPFGERLPQRATIDS